VPPVKKAAGAKRARVSLPTITVQRFEESLKLVERIAEEEQSGFLKRMQDFRAEYRQSSDRPLTAEEATRFAASMADAYSDEAPEDVAARLQRSELYAYEDPEPREVLVSAGLSTAPAFVRAVRQFVALIEMPAATFTEAFEHDTLEGAIEEGRRALGNIAMSEARTRTRAAFEHWGTEVGVASGEAIRRLVQTVMGALEQAASRVTAANLSPGLSHLSTNSPEPTAGPAETSSTTSATATP
jgi:hypothetical protein